MKKNNKKIYIFRYMNKPILILSILFALFGALFILDASSISAVLRYKLDTYYFFTKQLKVIGLSLVAALLIIKLFSTKSYKAISLIASIIFITLLLIVFIKNKVITTDVSEVTLQIGGFSLQPAEFLKVFLIMYLGCFFGSWINNPNRKKWSYIIPLCICAVACFLILLGGDYGSAALMVALFAIIFISLPYKEKYFSGIKILAVGGLVLALLVLKFSYKLIPEKVLESSPRLNRLLYTNPCDRYEESSGYQVCNGYIAIDNGGLLGVGVGNSIQKYLYLPESHTDFIFPIIVEEFGIVTGVAIILAYIWLIYLIFKVAVNCYELQNSIICYGIGIYIMLHVFVNLGGVLGVIPLTGVPLPFLSYGGSFCLVLICSLAVVQRIHIENQVEKRRKLANN